MTKKPAKYDRLILVWLLLISISVAILSLTQLENSFAAIVLGIAAVIYIIIRLTIRKLG